MEVRVYCPAAVGFIFKYCPHKTIARTGSIGIGCTIDKGVTACVSVSEKTTIVFNKKRLEFPTVSYALARLSKTPLLVELSSPLPLGCGFGLSGACTLTALYAANTVLRLGKNEKELALIAHESEIENKTGLGTVATQITGGFLVKKRAGIPVVSTRLPFIGKKIYAIILGEIATPMVLNDTAHLASIQKAAKKALSMIRLLPHPTLGEIIDHAYQYAQESHLTTVRIQTVIKQLHRQRIHATMAMLGEVILCDIKPNLYNYRIEELTITKDTVHLL